MKRLALPLLLAFLGMAAVAQGGFKVKLVEPKKPDQFQVHTIIGDIIFAADLLVGSKEQKKFFFKELTPSRIIAVRLAVFNRGRESVVLPLQTLQLIGPDGREVAMVGPGSVAEALLQGKEVSAVPSSKGPPVAVSPGIRTGDPRLDPTDPRYDPRLDPRDPRYDPNRNPTHPGYDPNDPRNRYPGSYDGPWIRPGVDVVLNPGGGGGGDLSANEQALVRKDFQDKAHSTEPVLSSQTRDKFLYFAIETTPASGKGFRLILTPGKGIPREVVLEF